MPVKSKKQENFMRMALSPEGRRRLKSRGKKPPPKRVAREYLGK